MRTQIRKIGNSLGNIIPAAFIQQLRLKEGMEVEIRAEKDKIIIVPVSLRPQRFPFSEQTLLDGITAHTAHADELASVSGKDLGE